MFSQWYFQKHGTFYGREYFGIPVSKDRALEDPSFMFLVSGLHKRVTLTQKRHFKESAKWPIT